MQEEMVNPEIINTSKEIVPSRQRGPRPIKMATSEQPIQAKDLKGHTDAELIDRKDLEYQRKLGNELVRGKFINDETPGEAKAFCFKKFRNDPIKKYVLKDHGIYELPLMVAQHLNDDCKIPMYGLSKDEDGNVIEIISSWKNRCHFESLEFSRSSFSDKPMLREKYS